MRSRALASGVVLLSLAGAFASCADEALVPEVPATPARFQPPPETCDPVDPTSPRVFTPCSKGSGSFGAWVLDDRGLPAYEYGLDENTDDRARYFNTEGLDRREHWAQFGNGRVSGMFFNDGYVEVTDQDRGVEYLDKADEAQGAFAGAFSFITEGEKTWCSAYKWRPAGASTRRRFGLGYGEAITSYDGIRVARKTFAPKGDLPFVIDEVALTNESTASRSFRHWEYFDVGRRPIEIDWLVSGAAIASIPADVRKARDARDGLFDEEVTFDATARALRVGRSHAQGVTAPPPGQPNATDYYPGDPFLAALDGDVADTFTDQATFFGGADPSAPRALVLRSKGEGASSGSRGRTSGLGQPRMFALATDVDALAPGETRTLRFAYGKTGWGEPLVLDPTLRDPSRDLLAEIQADLRDKLVYFASDEEPALLREMAWHAYQMQASVGYREYFEGRVVPQGSAYLFLHGADGAARDLAVFTMPLVYSDPDLARAELELYMRIQYADGQGFSYAFQGHGVLDDALGLHHAPSDLDLFFLWAMGEYLAATGDLAFLDRRVPFWPKEKLPDATAYDHLHAAVRHLFDVVGTGEHGLIRLSTGDWSDGITVEAPNRQLAIDAGESVPNTQMAIAVLPRVASLIDDRDPALAKEIRDRVTGYRAALASAWSGRFYGRAFFGDGVLVRGDTIDLEAQVWPLVADEVDGADRDALVDEVRSKLDEPSPTGATLQPGGAVWPAISGLLTEGYAHTRPDLAWAHYLRNTMFSHALAYPDEWYGIWSGPDGTNGPSQDRPGGAWYSVVTPMTDFPVQNNNQHAMPLLATLRLAGITAPAGGLRVEPKAPGRYTLQSKLVDVAVDESAVAVTYRPTGAARRSVELVAPAGHVVTSASFDGSPVNTPGGAKGVSFVLDPDHGRPYSLVVTIAPK